MHRSLTFLSLLIGCIVGGALGFTAPQTQGISTSSSNSFSNFATALHARGEQYGDASADQNEVIARKITLVGDVDGGYYRSCVKNEVRRC